MLSLKIHVLAPSRRVSERAKPVARHPAVLGETSGLRGCRNLSADAAVAWSLCRRRARSRLSWCGGVARRPARFRVLPRERTESGSSVPDSQLGLAANTITPQNLSCMSVSVSQSIVSSPAATPHYAMLITVQPSAVRSKNASMAAPARSMLSTCCGVVLSLPDATRSSSSDTVCASKSGRCRR